MEERIKTIGSFLFENRKLIRGTFESIYFKARAISEKHADEVLHSTINPEMLEIFENPDWQEEAGKYLSAEKFAALLLASADRDPDTTKTLAQKARSEHRVKKFLTVEHLMVLSEIDEIKNITESNFRDLIYFCAIGEIEPSCLALHLSKNAHLLENDNSKVYQKIKKNNLKLDEPTIEFFEHKIPFHYLEDFRNLSEDYKAEFWRWINLKYISQVKNPAYLFFNIYYNMKIDGLSFKDLQNRRKSIEGTGFSNFQKMESIDYDYWFELGEINKKMYDYNPIAFKSSEKTNKHHIFFPERKYTDDRKLKAFRCHDTNSVTILINTHERMNAYFKDLLISDDYEIPAIHPELIILIETNREYHAAGYLRFAELMKVVCQICIDYLLEYSDEELSKNEVFQNAKEMFRFLKIQSRFITPKTTKTY